MYRQGRRELKWYGERKRAGKEVDSSGRLGPL